MKEYLKDMSNVRQSVLLLMNTNEGLRHWRLNFNITEILPTESGEENTSQGTQYECDFVPENEGLISESPNFDMFVGELRSKGLSEIEIETIRENVQL